MSGSPRARPGVVGALVVAALVVVYLAATAVHVSLVNVDVGRHDQGAYLGMAMELARTHFAAPTNRMQMPAYPVLQAFFADPAADLPRAFLRAKIVNVALSLVFLAALHAYFRRTLPKLEACTLTMATAFTVFVFRACYVQAEVPFYTVTFFAFVALCRLWERPSFGVAIVAGCLEGLAFLFKGSMEPGLILFATLFLAREIWTATRPGRQSGAWALLAARFAQIATLVAAFLAPIAPFLVTSKRMYGEWFFNVSTHYVAWCDSWDQFMDMQARLGPWWTWGRFPASEMPSMRRFFATHSVLDVVKREVLGVGEVLGNAVIGHGYLEVVVLYGAFVAAGLGLGRAPVRMLRAIDPRSAAAFVIPYVLLYVGLFGFYAPIAAGARFVLMLFLPIVYSLMRAGVARQPTVTALGRTVGWRDFNAFVLVLVFLHVAFVLPTVIGRLYAGG